MSKISVHFGFKNGKLVTVVHTLEKDYEDAVNCDYYTSDPEESEKQITAWKEQAER